ncbi:MAG: EVE domain-containing protein [Deltaproteobacteria bacterium]|nr:EVE domain-containing protein [bacterium]MCB9475905.1 EVE domain-containing protein [Deltaproteobacteria bacterium]MCB9479702.1 EVE domain-containing protein [Deltaproteobacteria bacterium]MCB9488033.1 EVE domain-containing protein [Deltaproteobacteria bacterium]
MAYWLMKDEPDHYSWDRLLTDGKHCWSKVRNYQARNNIREMKKGDVALFYHSMSEKRVVGAMKVASAPYPNPDDDTWTFIDVTPYFPLKEPVDLATLKSDPATRDMKFIKQSRLSVSPVSQEEFDRIVELGGKGKLKKG